MTSMKTKVVNSTLDKEDKMSEHCTSYLSFDARSKELLSYLCSVCGCYDGRYFCSHFLSVLLFIRRAQRSKSNVDKFESHLPTNPLKTQSQLTLIKNVVDLKRSHKKHKHN